ncbi:hypothetical protein SGF_02782 [Shigella flexneri CDC 796-83]|uniref:Uncharacterized protein n=1 Tax=Shigella flexneri CDC 796-83 TaxID=945360 RepID=A0A6N3QN81_SHIFL|nr:hypothetical protein SGF_02782 [Shigella flexneri CDC 796-83]
MGTYVTNTGLMATYGGQFTLTKMHAGCVKCSNAQNNRNNQEVAYTSLNS